MSDMSPADIQKALHYWWLGEISYPISTAAVKLAIGVFLLRIAVSKLHKYIIYIIIAMNSIFSVFFFFMMLLQCTPISFFWNKNQKGHCINPHFIANATYTISAICII